jgi:hypothetical protein
MTAVFTCVEAMPRSEHASQAWLPRGKIAAICFSIDDIHPASSQDPYEAGGDMGAGALGRLLRLQKRHPDLKASLSVTPDWRLDRLVPNIGPLRHLPMIRRHVYWVRRHEPGRFRLDRHPAFADWLNKLERCEIVPHGLTHSHTGPRFAVEFQDESQGECRAIVLESLGIFRCAGIRVAPGYVPPAWNAPPPLIRALDELGIEFLSSARDIETPIAAGARTAMSGLQQMSLIYPQVIGPRGLVHITSNFQATSPVERAMAIIEAGGVLHIKAHVFKAAGGRVMLDGFDDLYCNYLDALFSILKARWAEQLWWAHLSEVTKRVRELS